MSLTDQIAHPSGDLLGLHKLLGPGTAAVDEVRRDVLERMGHLHEFRSMLEHLRNKQWPAVLVMNDSRIFHAIGKKRQDQVPIPIPVTPNLQGFVRDAVEHGLFKAGLLRAMRVGPMALAGVGLRGMTRASALFRRDFPTMLRSFIDLDLADFARYDPPVVFLHAQITDMALAFRNPAILQAFTDAVHDTTKSITGFATNNFGMLMASLKSWGIEPGAIITPWNAQGEQMRPDRETCLHAAKAIGCPIWADSIEWDIPPSHADRAVMKHAGIVGAIRNDLPVWLGS